MILSGFRREFFKEATYIYGVYALLELSEGNSATQEEICKKGGLTGLFYVLRECGEGSYAYWLSVVEMLFSTEEVLSKYCTTEILDAVRELSEMDRDNELIKRLLLSITRQEDPGIRDAVARGMCTKEYFNKYYLDWGWVNYGYWRSCADQRAFRCLTCDKDKIKFY